MKSEAPSHTHTLFKTCSCVLCGLIVPKAHVLGVSLTPCLAPQQAAMAPPCLTHLFSSANLSSSDSSLRARPPVLRIHSDHRMIHSAGAAAPPSPAAAVPAPRPPAPWPPAPWPPDPRHRCTLHATNRNVTEGRFYELFFVIRSACKEMFEG